MDSLTEAISQPLRRPIKNGLIYNSIIPKSSCSVASNFGDNKNTIEGVDFMADMVKKYSFQVQKLAKKLQKSSLEKTVQSIDDFLYHHLQYQADGALQQLRSPACSWKDRAKGIDCKSYSIFASSLLRELGINHFIRQIKQPNFYPNQYTHVYVIVPINQNSTTDTTNFNGNYLVIDPTDKTKIEPRFIEKKDKYMSGLTYVGLNAPISTGLQNQKTAFEVLLENAKAFKDAGFTYEKYLAIVEHINGMLKRGYREDKIIFEATEKGLSVGIGQNVVLYQSNNPNWLSAFKSSLANVQGLRNSDEGSFLSNIDWGKVFGSFGGLFGSGFYKPHHIEENAQRLANEIKSVVNELNTALNNKIYSRFSEKTAELLAILELVPRTFLQKKNERRWSGYSEDNLQASINISNQFRQKITQLLNAYLSKYFTQTGTAGSINITNENWEEQKGFFGMLSTPYLTVTRSIKSYQPKPNQDIPAFIVNTSLVSDIINNNPVNSSNFLNSLQTILITVTQPGGSGSGSGSGSSGGSSGGSGTVNPGTSTGGGTLPTTQQATIGGISTKTIAVAGAVAAAGFFLLPIIKKNNK